MYVIISDTESKLQGEPMFWSNHLGWTTLYLADVFTHGERQYLNLPVDGRWILMKDAEAMLKKDEYATPQ